MTEIVRRTIAAVFASVWMLCVLHCAADKATAHWHALPSGKIHHHHDFASEPHDHEGSHEGGSHESTEGECCTLTARVTLSALGERSQFVQVLFPVFNLIAVLIRSTDAVPESSQFRFTEVTRESLIPILLQMLSLLVPNAPPA